MVWMSDTARKQIHELIDELPEDQLPKVRQIIEETVRKNGDSESRSPLEIARALGVVGCVGGGPEDPTDLATNPAHMAGYGA